MIIRRTRQYGCVKCQVRHYEDTEPALFKAHLFYQDKHGWQWHEEIMDTAETLSKCCNAAAFAEPNYRYLSDEILGTYWVCSKCQKACDVLQPISGQ